MVLSPLYPDWNSTFGPQGYRHLDLDFIRIKQLEIIMPNNHTQQKLAFE